MGAGGCLHIVSPSPKAVRQCSSCKSSRNCWKEPQTQKTWATKAGWLDETHLPFPDCCALLFVLFPALAPAFSLSHYPRSVHAADEPLHRGCRAGEESLSQPDSPLVTPARVELCSIVDDWRACWG
ncbi:hypothetical protein BDBG_06039 [Blastomyces gilchristii SLH14081]|uniref:Uncharacterized protein n=1 Tax=Blastomyces gilchristii (strain SLH14081) TaxID=559298 RepID=A0A179USK2_BLAGS|nr:uncharacterized protein BDBG_06039 [Blastomyces gilchristii SLH14081]OAT11076.1 hypothetical protein BDBG_06039 [Blastomyces gilchristii SLH14081]